MQNTWHRIYWKFDFFLSRKKLQLFVSLPWTPRLATFALRKNAINLWTKLTSVFARIHSCTTWILAVGYWFWWEKDTRFVRAVNEALYCLETLGPDEICKNLTDFGSSYAGKRSIKDNPWMARCYSLTGRSTWRHIWPSFFFVHLLCFTPVSNAYSFYTKSWF